MIKTKINIENDKKERVPNRKKYSIIYADPPWYQNPRNNPNTKRGQECQAHYNTMKIEDIIRIDVPEITEDNAVMFLWSTWPHLSNAIKVIEAWGFKYSTLGFLRVKINKNGKLKNCPSCGEEIIEYSYKFGCGYWTKANSEPCLLAIKGKPPKPITNSISQIVSDSGDGYYDCVNKTIISPVTEHSVKPEIFKQLIGEMFNPDLEKIELFARTKSEGWDFSGNHFKKEGVKLFYD